MYEYAGRGHRTQNRPASPTAASGLAPKLQQQIGRIERLPRAKQKFVMEMIDTVLTQQSR